MTMTPIFRALLVHKDATSFVFCSVSQEFRDSGLSFLPEYGSDNNDHRKEVLWLVASEMQYRGTSISTRYYMVLVYFLACLVLMYH